MLHFTFRLLFLFLFVSSFALGFLQTSSPVSKGKSVSGLLQAADRPNENTSNDTHVTKEMFLREMLKHPADDDHDDSNQNSNDDDKPSVTVYRRSKKSKKKPYKVLDNRDSLPFAVTVTTPDPYTHPDEKKKAARNQSVTPKKRPDAVEAGISSSLYIDPNPSTEGKKKKKKGKKGDDSDDSSLSVDPQTHLGDFVLDKLTTTGDVLEIGDRRYKVVRHKCQYKYAGGQRFVMARKILQVKEVGRLQKEEYIQRQFDSDTVPPSFPPEEA